MYNIKNSKELASLINYTNLNNMISESEMKEFLEKAKELNFHSVVISPTYVPLAKEILADSSIKVGSVVGFPLGFEDTESKGIHELVDIREPSVEIKMEPAEPEQGISGAEMVSGVVPATSTHA